MWIEISVFLLTYILVKLFFTIRDRRRHFNSFASRGIPGPKPDLIFGNWLSYRSSTNRNDLMEEWFRKYGSIFGYYLGGHRYIVVKDLDLIQEAFLKNSAKLRNRNPFAVDSRYFIDSLIGLKDERWRLVRKIISPTFSQSKVQHEAISGVMQQCVDILNQKLKAEELQKKEEKEDDKDKSFDVDVSNKIQAFTLDVIARTSLDLKEDVYAKDNVVMSSVREFFIMSANIAVDLALFLPILRTIFKFINQHLTSGRMVDMIVIKLRSHIKRLLSGQSSSSDQESVEHTKSTTGETSGANVLRSLLQRFSEGQINEEEFIGNVLLILLAGYETSANAITYTLFLLAKHPQIQERLRQEVLRNGLESKYLDQVWMESLRFLPPVCLFVNRVFSEDMLLNGVQFLKGDIIQVPVWSIHRNGDIWPEPEVFDPERFADDNREQMHPCQFLAFGLGPRICLGAHFANYEGKLVISNLLRRYRIEKSSKTEDPITMVMPTVIINPKNNVHLKFVPLE